MNRAAQLPANYREIYSVNLQKNKKIMIWLNVGALLVAVLMAIPAAFVVPISALFDFSNGLLAYALRFVVLMVGMVAYIVLHELVHGITMKAFGTPRVRYGFTGVYAFAGSDDYYGKRAYITIALAPVVIWGILLAIGCMLVPAAWFWVVYIIQIANISGACGDFYVTCKFIGMPADILVKDDGVRMTVYSAQ